MFPLILAALLSLLLTACDPPKKQADLQSAVDSVKMTPVTVHVVETRIHPCPFQKFEKQGQGYVGVPGEPGFQHVEVTTKADKTTETRPLTHCVPCSKAKSSDEKFTCVGDEGRTDEPKHAMAFDAERTRSEAKGH